MRHQSDYLKKEKKFHSGQSLVEYIMMLAVVAVFMNIILNSAAFKGVFGANSSFFDSIQFYLESTYQFPYFSETRNVQYAEGQIHDSYVGSDGSRFWGPIAPTP